MRRCPLDLPGGFSQLEHQGNGGRSQPRPGLTLPGEGRQAPAPQPFCRAIHQPLCACRLVASARSPGLPGDELGNWGGICLPMADNKNHSPFSQFFAVYKALSKLPESSQQPYEARISKQSVKLRLSLGKRLDRGPYQSARGRHGQESPSGPRAQATPPPAPHLCFPPHDGMAQKGSQQP